MKFIVLIKITSRNLNDLNLNNVFGQSHVFLLLNIYVNTAEGL